MKDNNIPLEPEAHCFQCPQAKNGNCAEYNKLNPGYLKLFGVQYDRCHCHWGYESIKALEVKTIKC